MFLNSDKTKGGVFFFFFFPPQSTQLFKCFMEKRLSMRAKVTVLVGKGFVWH